MAYLEDISIPGVAVLLFAGAFALGVAIQHGYHLRGSCHV